MGTQLRAGFAGTLLLFGWACSGSEFNGAPAPSSSVPRTNVPDAGSDDADSSPPSEGGAGGSVIEPGMGGNPQGVDGGAGGEPTIEPGGGAGGQPVVIGPGCEGMMADCECVEGRCGPGLACTSEGQCITVPEPVAHWPLNVDAADVSGNGYNGVTHNGVVFENDAATFDGTDSYIDIASFSAKFNEIAGAMTVYIRVRASTWVTDPILFGSGDQGDEPESTNGFWFMVVDDLATVNTETNLGFGNLFSLGTALPLNAWLDLVFVIYGDAADLYVNGEWIESTAFVAIDPAAEHMQIGGWITPENVLNGTIDDVQVYDALLDDAQIAALPSRR